MNLPKSECEAFQRCILSYINRRKRKRLEKEEREKKQSNSKECSSSRSSSSSSLPASFLRLCQDAMYLTNHSIYILETLTIKRHSLSLAIRVFLMTSRECISCISAYQNHNRRPRHQQHPLKLSLKEVVQEVLTHIFTQYIHIRDGFVLLTSGECRHTADAKFAAAAASSSSSSSKKTTYKSKLDQSKERKDGYTKKFSSNCGYSGYGWDEFFDDDEGVKLRLLNVLLKLSTDYSNNDVYDKNNNNNNNNNVEDDLYENEYDDNPYEKQKQRNDLWERLLQSNNGSGIELFENAFDTHENIMKDLQRKLESYRTTIIQELEHVLNSFEVATTATDITSTTTSCYGSTTASMLESSSLSRNITITMNTVDKFERLELKNAKRLLELESFTIQREGNDFKGRDKRGALPSNISLQDWKNIMKLPSSLHNILHGGSANHDCNNGGDDEKSSKGIRRAFKKKKKLVICDSDDDYDDDNNIKNNVDNNRQEDMFVQGEDRGKQKSQDDQEQNNKSPNNYKSTLKVTFKQAEKNNTSNAANTTTSSSLYDIKKQLGVDVDELQRSREELEEEENISKKAAFVDETGCADVLEVRSNGDNLSSVLHENDAISNHNLHLRRQQRNPSTRTYDGDIEFSLSHLRMNRAHNLPSERNDIFHNGPSYSNLIEPSERITIGSKRMRQPMSSRNNNNNHMSTYDDVNRDFDNKFGLQVVADDDDNEDTAMQHEEEKDQIHNYAPTFLKWGDEVLRDKGIDVDMYPSSAPEKPPEMINELGLKE